MIETVKSPRIDMANGKQLNKAVSFADEVPLA